jgi:hypothetical protein
MKMKPLAEYYLRKTKEALDDQKHCRCSTSSSVYADIWGRPICQNCGRPIKGVGTISIPIPYELLK